VPPVEPPPSAWEFPDPLTADEHGLVTMGGDLDPGTLLDAYRSGLFPLPLRTGLGWFCPDPRAIVPLDGLRLTRSLRQSCKRYEVRVDTAFEEVIDACADPTRPHAWIDAGVRAAYVELHRLGWTHSVEAWDPGSGELVGGLYGVATGGLFAGESMFHRARDASKVALVGLVELLRADGDRRRLIDAQWQTPHLESLGAVEVPAARYLELLQDAMAAPLPPAFHGSGSSASAV
jgi:leucyl/phenylalanyl-tRNA---protein transferase